MANIIVKGPGGVTLGDVERARAGVRRRIAADHAREHRVAKEGHARARKEDRPRNGFTKGRLFRHVARAPVSDMQAWRGEDKHRICDKKDLKKFINSGGFNTVRSGSF